MFRIFQNWSLELPSDPSRNSSRRNELGLDKSSFNRIVKLDLNLHCYRIIRKFEMKDTDRIHRVKFARYYLSLTEEQRLNIAFSDESNFTLDGVVNSQTVRGYGLTKDKGGGRPDNLIQTEEKYSPKVMVFLGLHSSGNISLSV